MLWSSGGREDLHQVRKHILHEEKVSLSSCGPSPLVIDRLCDWARGHNAAVACFYFDFAAQKEQSPASVLGSLLRQVVVSGLENIPPKVVQAFRDQEKFIGGRKLELGEIVEVLQSYRVSRPHGPPSYALTLSMNAWLSIEESYWIR